MAYAAWSVVFGEQPSAAKWNILGTNDASFNDGTGIADGAITPAKRSGGFATGTLTPGATGNLATTGLGFTPRMVEFTWLPGTSTTNSQEGTGVMTSSAQSTTSSAQGASFSRYSSTSNCISCLNPASSTPFQLASYVSMDSDGFTVNFSAQGGAQISWKAYR